MGQSETAVRSMTDFFLLLMLAGAGDELQGMKRGIIEMLDGMAINKADGDNQAEGRARARRVRRRAAPVPGVGRRLDAARADLLGRSPKKGIAEIWQMVLDHRELLEGNGFLAQRRNRQALQWMNELTMLGLEELFRRNRAVAGRLPLLREEVHRGRMTPFAASRELLALFRLQPNETNRRRDFMIAISYSYRGEAASLIRQRTNRWFQRIHAGRRAESDSDGDCRSRRSPRTMPGRSSRSAS